MDAKPHVLAQILQSGEYSDFALVCGGERFPLHKVIVCPQSPVIAAAINGPFKEASVNELAVDEFGVETVRHLVKYLYTGEYDGYLDNDDIAYHFQVYRIADYYNVTGLIEITSATIKQLLYSSGLPTSLPSLLKEVQLIRNDTLLSCFASRAANDIHELVKLDEFAEVVGNDMVLNIIKACSKRMLKDKLFAAKRRIELEREAEEMEARAEKAEARLAQTRLALRTCLDTLNERSICRHCSADFDCYIESHGSEARPVYTLRCSLCGTRHK